MPPVFFIVYKGTKGLDLDEISFKVAFAWALGLGVVCTVVVMFTVLPYMRKDIANKMTSSLQVVCGFNSVRAPEQCTI